jgi:flagellar hook protein FlgE
VDGVIDKYDTDVNSDDGRVMNLEFFDNQGYKYTAKLSVHAIDGDKGQFYVKLDNIIDAEGNSIMYDKDGKEIPGVTDKFTFGSKTDSIKDGTGAEVMMKNPDYVVGGTEPEKIPVTNAIVLQYVEGEGTFSYVGLEAGLDSGGETAKLEFGGLPIFPANGIDIDFSATFNYNKNGVSTMSSFAGLENGEGEGRKVGDLSGITVQKDGKIYASYDNGQRRLLGQIAVATFANPSGLEKEGDNLYSATMNSGDFDGVGEDITQNGGRMDSGMLEMSNVDLSQQFTEMITTQRGFQANSRIITVSDTLLEELTNLKR